MEVTLKFAAGDVIPEVKRGHLLDCIIVTERSGQRASFAAYYLNAFPLDHGDECICKTEADHDDGCPTTGWFYDESNFEYDNCYHAVVGTVLLWAPIPKAAEILAASALPIGNQKDST